MQFECPVKKRWMNVRKGTVSEYVLKIAESKNPKARIPMRNMPMVLARVVGTVVSTRKEPKIEGIKFLLLEKINPETFEGKKDYVVAMDSVGAGPGEIVFYVSGSSSRMTAVTEGRPSDATITAIVDAVDIEGKYVYQKDR